MEAKGFQLVSPVIDSLINGYCSFFIAPDGSKEGYDASDDADKIRRLVVSYLMTPSMKASEVHFVEMSYGSDDVKAVILNLNLKYNLSDRYFYCVLLFSNHRATFV